MEFQYWLELVSVGITATAIGIPLGSFFKWILKNLIREVRTEPEGNGNNDGNGRNAHGV